MYRLAYLHSELQQHATLSEPGVEELEHVHRQPTASLILKPQHSTTGKITNNRL